MLFNRISIVISLILIVFSFSLTKAQGGFNVGMKLGGNYTRINNANFNSDELIEHFPNVGFAGGVSVGYNAPYYNIGFTTGAYYKTYSQTFQYIPDSTLKMSWKNNYNLAYLEVPLLLRVRSAGDQRTKTFTYGGPYFEIGLQGGMLLSANQSSPDSLPQRYVGEDISDKFEKYTLAAVIGVGGHQVGTEHWAVTHGIRLTMSLLDINANNVGQGYIPEDGSGAKPYKPFRFISAGYMLAISYKF